MFSCILSSFEDLKQPKNMAAPSKLYTLCSLLMASLFAYSASVQLNDHDWYFWFPLYVGACVVNLVNCAISSKAIKLVAEVALWLGIFLFIKVTAENMFLNGVSAGFWSPDLSERVIREKMGSGLVIIPMILQLAASFSSSEAPSPKKRSEFPRYVEYGTASLVGFSYELPFVFFVVQKGEMKF